MDVNFSVFIDKILAGEKRQTIRRASQKWENVKTGDKLTLYTGLQTKECRKLGEAVVESVGKVAFYQAGLIGAITRDGEFWLTADEMPRRESGVIRPPQGQSWRGDTRQIPQWRQHDPADADGAAESLLGRVAYGVANRIHRLKAIGNGQVPLVAATAFNILMGDL